MNEWYPFATRRPGPANKQGYTGLTASTKRGDTKHDAGGPAWAGIYERLDSTTQISWHFTIGADRIEQHYSILAPCWHSGDTDPRDGVRGNIDLVGIEHLRVGDQLSPWQVEQTAALSRWLADQFGYHTFARYPDMDGQSWMMAEHRELSATSCPSGRIPWDGVFAQLPVTSGILASVEDMEDLADLRTLRYFFGAIARGEKFTVPISDLPNTLGFQVRDERDVDNPNAFVVIRKG